MLPILLGILVLVVAGLAIGEYIRRRNRESRLIYMVLPPYEVPELIVTGGVLVENRGTAPARDIRIALAYPDAGTQKIRHLQVMSDVQYVQQSGGESESFVTLAVQQINPNQKLIIYFSGPDRLLPRVTVMQGVDTRPETKKS